MPMFLILANSLRSEEKKRRAELIGQADLHSRGFRNFIITELKFIFRLFQL